ncbi:hypothetical protein LCGC14_3092000, partial [marine sediment metagenome]
FRMTHILYPICALMGLSYSTEGSPSIFSNINESQILKPKDNSFILGYHCYMMPDVAARLLLKLYSLPKHNDDLPNDDYPDLSLQPLFQ